MYILLIEVFCNVFNSDCLSLYCLFNKSTFSFVKDLIGKSIKYE